MNVDCLYYNANIRISSFSNRDLHWMAVTGGRISAIGVGRPPRTIFSKTRINLERKRVVPGWIDSHVHLVNLGLRASEVDCSRCYSIQELANLLKKEIARKQKARDMSWLVGYGLNTDRWDKAKSLTAYHLDQVSRHIPILIRRVDEHAIWVNSILHPRGYLVDAPMMKVLNIQPQPTFLGIEKALVLAQNEFLKYGVTSVQDMSSERSHIECLSNLYRNHRYDLRVACALYGEEALDTYTTPQAHLYDASLSIRSKKIFVDGALGSRGAWLSQPYQDDTLESGERLLAEDEIVRLIRQALQKRFQLSFHVLGDRASEWILEILSKYFKPEQVNDKRFRFEHVEVFNSKNLDRMKTYGIIASVQPQHPLSDSAWVESRVGKERLPWIGKIKSFLMKQIPTCGGSDAPIEDWNPLWGIYAAVTRRPIDGKDIRRSWLLDQKISIREAMSLYTEQAAYAEFSEHIKGTLNIGKVCDFAVLSHDILNMSPKDFLDVKCLMTVIGGKIVYE